MSHTIRMLIACLVPIVLIFLWPILGLDDGIGFTIFLIVIIAAHGWMCGSHHAEHGDDHKTNGDSHAHS